MSYPPIRYAGKSGEMRAYHREAGGPPDTTGPSGDTFRYLATGQDTQGDLGIYEVELGPGAGTEAHFHRTMSEAFYILSGTLRLFDGQDWTNGKAGDFFHVQAGGVHGFRNESDDRLRLLMLFTPGAPREEYFSQIEKLPGLTDQERAEFFARHDTVFVEHKTGPICGRRT